MDARCVVKFESVAPIAGFGGGGVDYSPSSPQFRMHRQPEHVMNFLLGEMGTSGSLDGQQRLVVKGRFAPKKFEGILRRYVYKPPLEELQYFSDFQIPQIWALIPTSTLGGHQRKERVCPSLQFSLIGPKLHINTEQRQKRRIRNRRNENLYVQLSEAMECLEHICTEGCTTIGPHDKGPPIRTTALEGNVEVKHQDFEPPTPRSVAKIGLRETGTVKLRSLQWLPKLIRHFEVGH